MDIITSILGYLAGLLAGIKLFQAGEERNWVKFWSAIILFGLSCVLLN